MQPNTIAGIQYLRAIAALLVLLRHAAERYVVVNQNIDLSWLILLGASGVDIFFILSGFIMVHTTFVPHRKHISPADFVKKRVVRIFPLYWLCCLAILIINVLGYLTAYDFSVFDILTSLFLLPLSDNDLIFVAWTLEYEMFFYLVFAITLFFKSYQATLFATSFFIFISFILGSQLSSNTINTFLSNAVLFEFVLGMLLAAIYKKQWVQPLVRYSLGIVAIVFLILNCIYRSELVSISPEWDRFLYFGLPSFFLSMSFLNFNSPQNILPKGLFFIGNASYSLYLTHVFVMHLYSLLITKAVIVGTNNLLSVMIIIFASILLGSLTYWFVERRLIKILKTWPLV